MDEIDLTGVIPTSETVEKALKKSVNVAGNVVVGVTN
jgi:hypothetical protein